MQIEAYVQIYKVCQYFIYKCVLGRDGEGKSCWIIMERLYTRKLKYSEKFLKRFPRFLGTIDWDDLHWMIVPDKRTLGWDYRKKIPFEEGHLCK